MDEGRAPGRIWLVILAATTLWYAWPQFLYSLSPVGEALRVIAPEWVAAWEPWIRALLGR
jgi:hypothetical protein